MNDRELLRNYVENGSDGAFTRLVEQHLSLVYSAANRLVRDPHLAQDVTQQVFTLLARKASRLGSDTILSAWLYRAARNLASETARRERRRHRREQLAVETMNQSSPDTVWRQIEPLLDEAMGKLTATDHDAIVLRYFENRSLKEVGEAFGSSEDAAQKRVARALDRLRMNLTRSGVTASVTALGVAVTSGAVQSAPAGLAASATSVSLAAGTGTSVLPNALQFMATNVKVMTAIVVAAALSVSLVVLRNHTVSLRRDLALLRASLEQARTSAMENEIAVAATGSNELRRLRMEHLELLSLRGRVTQLAKELRDRKAAGAQANTSSTPVLEQKESDSILFSAALTNRVPSRHTLVVGGWSAQGMRGYLLATPVVENAGSGEMQITVQSQIVRAPQNFWEEIGWGSYKSDTRRSAVAGVLTPEQLESLLQAVRETKEADLSNTSLARRRDGEFIGIGFARKEDDESGGTLMSIELHPRIAPDGLSVDLELLPGVMASNAEIHPALRPAPGATSP